MKTIDDTSTRCEEKYFSPTSFVATSETKIEPGHRERWAVVYVRQSDPQQVKQHRESGALQYKLARSARDLGWSEDRVLIIDEDQGISGRTAEGREGFQRLLAEVGLNHVGLVLGIEMSRLARSSKDWHQLIELCAIFHTLLADQDGLYDPTDFNDRLLLGLKGTMSEAELHILKGRMDKGRLNKAARGELFSHVPCGYVRLPSGEVALDPDEQARSVIRLLFEKFQQLRAATAVHRYLIRHDVRLPIRVHAGPRRGELEWRRPSTSTVVQILRRPIYAGAYAYGRRQVDPRRKVPGRPHTGHLPKRMDEWHVLLRDRLPAYITWEQYLDNQEQLDQHAGIFSSPGPPREGPSLLAGLMVCGRCQRRMVVHYQKSAAHYQCVAAYFEGAEHKCQTFSGAALEELLAKLVLEVLEPATVELSLQAAADIQQERGRLHEHWQQRLQRAEYQVQRARRQYDVVDPENRLVARELERQWEESLKEQRQAEEDYHRFHDQQPAQLSDDDQLAIRNLSRDLPALWQAGSTTNAERQTVVRQLVERVVVNVQGKTEYVDMTVHWVGGFVTQHEVVRTITHYEQLRDFPRIKSRLLELRDEGRTSQQIAACLNAEGFHTVTRGKQYTAQIVHKLCSRFRRTASPNGQTKGVVLKANEWWLTDLTRELSIPWSTLSGWCRKGWVRARQTDHRWWIVWADEEEQQRLRTLHAFVPNGAYPAELITPKQEG